MTATPVTSSIIMTNAEYHRHPAISKGHLDAIAKSPAHYKARYIDGIKPDYSPAFVIGSAAHSLILEPENFARDFAVAPEGINRRTNEGKAQWAEFESNAGRRTIIDAETYQQAKAIAAAVHRHPAAGRLFEIGEAERSIITTDSETGAQIKCRTDWLDHQGLIVDVKTTEDASPDGFAKSIANYRYHVQAAWYWDCIEAAYDVEPAGFVFVAVEKKPPYAVGVYLIGPDSMSVGRQLARRDLRRLIACRDANHWPDYGDDVQSIEIPRWAMSAR